MVREFGLSKELGPVGYPEGGSVFLGGGGGQGLSSRPFSQKRPRRKYIAEVSALLFAAEKRAVDLLSKNRDKLRRLTDLLLSKETVDGADVYGVAGVPEPKGIETGSTLAPERGSITARPQAEARRAVPG